VFDFFLNDKTTYKVNSMVCRPVAQLSSGSCYKCRVISPNPDLKTLSVTELSKVCREHVRVYPLPQLVGALVALNFQKQDYEFKGFADFYACQNFRGVLLQPDG
jgi:hypothetical protein